VHVVASPLERAQQTAEPIAAQFGLPVGVDERLIESANWFEGKKVSPGDGSFRDPRNWWVLRDPVTPSWGEAYRVIAERMFAALHAARIAAEGREAVLVSHQLPIWTLRRYVGASGSGTTRVNAVRSGQPHLVHFDGAKVVGIGYSEPAAHLIAMSPTARTAGPDERPEMDRRSARRRRDGGTFLEAPRGACATRRHRRVRARPASRRPKLAGELLTGAASSRIAGTPSGQLWAPGTPCRAGADDREHLPGHRLRRDLPRHQPGPGTSGRSRAGSPTRPVRPACRRPRPGHPAGHHPGHRPRPGGRMPR
jgi:hypothetical protein